MVIPTQAQEIEVSNNLLLAESIIVGSVPESFVGYNPDGDVLNPRSLKRKFSKKDAYSRPKNEADALPDAL